MKGCAKVLRIAVKVLLTAVIGVLLPVSYTHLTLPTIRLV